ncbi:MAG: acyl-CoA synthetase [Gammaproteobacteria bacterium]
MVELTALTSYADAQRHCSPEKLWELFDGNAARFNIAHECVDRFARTGRDAVMVAHADGSDERISCADLAADSSRFAHWLVAAGVQAGDRVALMLEPSSAFYVSLFGTLKAGAVAVPMFTLFGPEGVRLRIADCSPRVMVTNAEKAAQIGTLEGLTVIVFDDDFLRRLGAFSADFEIGTAAGDMAVFQYTSGTTRELPEAVRHTHRALVTLMLAGLYGTGLRPGDRFFCPSSPAWGHGLWHGTFAPLALGICVGAYGGKFDPERLLQALAEHRITNLSAAATHYRMMRNSGAAERHRFCIEKLSFTGEPIDGETAEWAEQTFGRPVCSMYGTTEIGVILVNYPGAQDFAVKPGSLGRPIPGLKIEVQDAFGMPAPVGVTGELKLWRRGAWMSTKDLARVDEDGYFWHGGRADDVIVSAGWTIGAVEVEDAIMKHRDVSSVAVIGVPDDVRGQIVKAFVVSQRPGDAAFEDEIKNLVRTRLSQHEYPRIVAFVDELPRNPAGKVNRKALREQEAASRKQRSAEGGW